MEGTPTRQPPETRAGRIGWLRGRLAELEQERRQLETELTALLVEDERRPGDGSDQPGLFEADQPKLF